MYELKISKSFKKSLKRIEKRGYNLSLLKEVVDKLQRGETLPTKYKSHELTGNYKGNMECHIKPDWILIYRIDNDILILTLVETGSHSDLFNM